MLKMILSGHSKGDSTMFPLSHNFLKFAAASAIVALTGVGVGFVVDHRADSAATVVRLIERYGALVAERRENGLMRPDRP